MYIQTHTLLSLTDSAQIYQLLKKTRIKMPTVLKNKFYFLI